MSAQRRFDVAHESHSAFSQDRHALPRDVFAKQANRSHRRARPQISKSGEPSKRMPAEEIAAVLPLKVAPCERATGDPTNKAECGKTPVTRTDHIARRAESA